MFRDDHSNPHYVEIDRIVSQPINRSAIMRDKISMIFYEMVS
jgi:hypothetical protein